MNAMQKMKRDECIWKLKRFLIKAAIADHKEGNEPRWYDMKELSVVLGKSHSATLPFIETHCAGKVVFLKKKRPKGKSLRYMAQIHHLALAEEVARLDSLLEPLSPF